MRFSERLKQYQSRRLPMDQWAFCQAPNVSLNFAQDGKATACCYNRSFVLGTYPKNTLAEIWNGRKAAELRKAMEESDLSKGCRICEEQFESGNYDGMRARFFDGMYKEDSERAYKKPLWPRLMEFEISNTCNLQCLMCNGYFSSAIRTKREGLPQEKSPYDRRFVEQLRPFLMALKWAKFLGGEPFLISLFYDIWEELIRINPGINAVVTTNGTVLNDRVRDVLDRLNPFICVSLDSLQEKTFERIRRGASFRKVRSNVEAFIEYSHRTGRSMDILVCPMPQNWDEMPALTSFCNVNDLNVFFNTVLFPKECSLKDLPGWRLREVAEFLENAPIERGKTRRTEMNLRIYRGFVSQVTAWAESALVKDRGDLGL
jgi:MoaA/NifB/PqqE/SkfB family radical SAM enzyme